MASLRTFYEELRGNPRITLGADKLGDVVMNRVSGVPPHLLGAVTPPQALFLDVISVSKQDPAGDELTRVRTDIRLERAAERAAEEDDVVRHRRKQPQPRRIRPRTGGPIRREFSYTGRIRSSDGENLSAALDWYNQYDAEAVDLVATHTPSGLTIRGHFWQYSGEIQSVLQIDGFPTTAEQMLADLTKGAFMGDLARLGLASARLVIASAPCHVNTALNQLPVEAEVNVLAVVQCFPNMLRAGVPPVLDLFGPVFQIASDLPSMRLRTYPQFTLRLDASFHVRRAFFEVHSLRIQTPSLGDVKDMDVGIGGKVLVYGEEWDTWADMPHDNGLLAFHLKIPADNPDKTDLSELQSLFGAQDDWRRALPGSAVISPAGLEPLIMGYRLLEAVHVFDAVTQRVASLSVAIQSLGAFTLGHPRGFEIRLDGMILRWMIGLPDGGSERGVSVEAEATMTFTRGPDGLRDRLWQARIGFAPHLEVAGAVEASDLSFDAAQGLAQDLGLTFNPNESDLEMDGSPQAEASIFLNWATGVRLTLSNESSQSITWT